MKLMIEVDLVFFCEGIAYQHSEGELWTRTVAVISLIAIDHKGTLVGQCFVGNEVMR